MVLSIMGEYRGGKSFFLNILKEYLLYLEGKKMGILINKKELDKNQDMSMQIIHTDG